MVATRKLIGCRPRNANRIHVTVLSHSSRPNELRHGGALFRWAAQPHPLEERAKTVMGLVIPIVAIVLALIAKK